MLLAVYLCFLFFFFFNDTATTEIYTLSLHDALPIYFGRERCHCSIASIKTTAASVGGRSEEHTSELQSPDHLVCRLLLEKKKKKGMKTCYSMKVQRATNIALR